MIHCFFYEPNNETSFAEMDLEHPPKRGDHKDVRGSLRKILAVQDRRTHCDILCGSELTKPDDDAMDGFDEEGNLLPPVAA